MNSMKTPLAALLAIVLIASPAQTAFAAGSGSGSGSSSGTQTQNQTHAEEQAQEQTQNQTQDQTQSQTQNQVQDQTRTQTQLQDTQETSSGVQNQEAQRIRQRIQVSDQARTQLQQRMQEQSKVQFSDIEQHWAKEQIRSAYAWGFINGYPDGRFEPDGKISGAEGILMTARMIKALNSADTGDNAVGTVDWNRVPQWAKAPLQDPVALKLAAQSSFYGELQMNRLQFAVMLAKGLGIQPPTVSPDTLPFSDIAALSTTDAGYLSILKELGILTGSNGQFNPNQTITRAEAACILNRVVSMNP